MERHRVDGSICPLKPDFKGVFPDVQAGSYIGTGPPPYNNRCRLLNWVLIVWRYLK